MLTEWYEPHIKPVRSGNFMTQFFDAGWAYEWMAYWDMDRQAWRDNEGGLTLIDQNITWRGRTSEQTK